MHVWLIKFVANLDFPNFWVCEICDRALDEGVKAHKLLPRVHTQLLVGILVFSLACKFVGSWLRFCA